MFWRRRAVHFVYADRYRFAGSTIMRGEQLTVIAQQSLGERRRVSFSPSTADFRNSTLFLTKGALKELPAGRLAELKRNGNTLLFDVVDERPPPTTAEYADVLVAASITAFTDFALEFPTVQVALVNHHVDPRIADIPAVASPRGHRLRAAYFGELANAIFAPPITAEVTQVPIDTSRASSDWLLELPRFNFHYAMRQYGPADNHKPFLKGFTAAHCASNIMIQSSDSEAVHWLGADYPYLLSGAVTTDSIVDGLHRARESFGSTEWDSALAAMASVRARTTPARIGAELRRILD